ncbi:hypothetical protein SAY87_015788 [Trapa incisa]|uniref:Uncharacterized protein n=1 Tax=Trapa incisa TaxID=236973 RepID=A0AAN7L4W7_9MYRT|nr:hypothetical protein SAY87_015788 [Trapa incisa]
MLLIEPVWNEPRRRLEKEPPTDAWIRPPIETVKNSCDGSFSTKLEPAVVGILARDHSSRVLFGGGKQGPARSLLVDLSGPEERNGANAVFATWMDVGNILGFSAAAK